VGFDHAYLSFVRKYSSIVKSLKKPWLNILSKGGIMKFAGWFGIIVGIGMMLMWTFFLVSGQIPEINSEPYRIAFHLAAEFATAIGLVISGLGILRNRLKFINIYLVSGGMLVYSLIVSPGYYAQLGDWNFVVMFTVLLISTIASLMTVITNQRP
jgi:hypothetical protein